MAYSLNIVAVRIKNKRTVVIRMIVQTQAGWAIVAATRRNCRFIECVNMGTSSSAKRHMHRGIIGQTLAYPEVWLWRFTETSNIGMTC